MMPNKSIFAIAAIVLGICLPIAQPAQSQTQTRCSGRVAAQDIERVIIGGGSFNTGLQLSRKDGRFHDGSTACDQQIKGILIQKGVIKSDTSIQENQPIMTNNNNPVANGCAKFSDLIAMADKGMVEWRCEGGSMYIQRL